MWIIHIIFKYLYMSTYFRPCPQQSRQNNSQIQTPRSLSIMNQKPSSISMLYPSLISPSHTHRHAYPGDSINPPAPTSHLPTIQEVQRKTTLSLSHLQTHSLYILRDSARGIPEIYITTTLSDARSLAHPHVLA